ncbi:MAG: HIT family protein [Candidatus Aenigmarchaeota archaeon]|nr:HIT family protein [Candidatus Aenigmarchaeota archaeon]
MNCGLCDAINQDYRLVKEFRHSICSIIKWPLKLGHVIVIPKRHVINFNELTKDEAKNLLDLLGYMSNILQKAFGDNTVIHTNIGLHRSEEHLHIHMLPSKGGIRELVSSLEGVPLREDVSQEKTQEMRDYILKFA